jgi:hypothetical protein
MIHQQLSGTDTRKVLESLGYDESKMSELSEKKIVAIGINKQ